MYAVIRETNDGLEAIRDSMDAIRNATENGDRVLSDLTMLSMALDYFDKIWMIVNVARYDWWPNRTPNDPGENALMEALVDVDGFHDAFEDDKEFICDECREKAKEKK